MVAGRTSLLCGLEIRTGRKIDQFISQLQYRRRDNSNRYEEKVCSTRGVEVEEGRRYVTGSRKSTVREEQLETVRFYRFAGSGTYKTRF